MRLWACGVLVHDKPDVYLFDPRLGLPLPGPKGEGIATLKAACTDPTVLSQLTVSDAHRYDVTPEQAAKAELRYVCALSALAPRIGMLECELLAPAVKIRLAADAAEEWKRLTTAAKDQIGPNAVVRAWNDGKSSGAGVLRRFLPPDEGGIDVSKPSRRERFTLDIVPWGAMPEYFRNENQFPPQVGLGRGVRIYYAEPFVQIALEPHHARDDQLRGRLNEAIPELVDIRTNCQDMQNALSQENKNKEFGKEVEEWRKRGETAYADQQRAAGNALKLEEANAKITELWNDARSIRVALFGTRAWPLRLAVCFQLALSKQTQAERLQLQSELSPQNTVLAEKALDAWREAVNAWQQYLEAYNGTRYAAKSDVCADRVRRAACEQRCTRHGSAGRQCPRRRRPDAGSRRTTERRP